MRRLRAVTYGVYASMAIGTVGVIISMFIQDRTATLSHQEIWS